MRVRRQGIPGTTIQLCWISADKQSNIPMGEFESPELAQAAIEAGRAELLEQCADDNQRAAIRAGMWEVVTTPHEEQEGAYAMPFLMIGPCSHACTWLIVRTTLHYDATRLVCPRNCTYPKTDIAWRRA